MRCRATAARRVNTVPANGAFHISDCDLHIADVNPHLGVGNIDIDDIAFHIDECEVHIDVGNIDIDDCNVHIDDCDIDIDDVMLHIAAVLAVWWAGVRITARSFAPN